MCRLKQPTPKVDASTFSVFERRGGRRRPAMCGISAVVTLSSDGASGSEDYRTRLHEQMQASLDKIEHRGPDGRGVWISADARVGTAFIPYRIDPTADGPS